MPFSTDLYLPAFGDMALSLDSTIARVTLTMSSFFVGSCIGQLINGPILDKYGRKTPMMIGLGVFALSSVFCYLSANIETLIIMRIFQAIGISICNIGSKAVVRDVFESHETAKIFSILGLIMGISPVIAPTVGSWLLAGWGWRSIFSFLTIFSVILIIALWFFLPQTLAKDHHYSMRLSNIIQRYKTVLHTERYLGYTVVTSLCSSILFAWISSSSFIFMDLLSLSSYQFGMVFASTASCLVIGNQLNILLLRKFTSRDIALGATSIQLILCIVLYWISQNHFTVGAMIAGVCSLIFFLHMITTNSMAIALNSVDQNLGVASAFMGSLRMALSALTTIVLSYFISDSPVPMIVMIACITFISLSLQISLKQKYDG